jgi:Domain of unknown function (DUF397)
MLGIDRTTVTWHRSSFSESGNCVEAATQDRSVLIRDSKNPDEEMLCVSSGTWQSFIQAVQRNTAI